MPLIWPAKDPDEVLDYTWTAPLEAGDAISSLTLTKVSGSVTLDSQDTDGASITTWLSGGADGETCEFLGRAVTTAGRTYDETILLAVQASDTGAEFVAQFLAAFPAFAGVPSATIALWHGQAGLIVTDSLTSCLGDRADMASMLLTAHYLTLAGLGTGTEAQMAAQGMGSFKSIKSGSLSLERGDVSMKGGELATTSYGARAWAMIAPCLAGPRVTGTGYVVGGCGFNGFAGPLPGYM